MIEALKQNKKQVLQTVGVCVAVALAAYFILPKKYKVSTSIALQTQYFQLPMVSGFLPETLDPQELKSKREALLQFALNQKFLMQIATKYNLVKNLSQEASNNYELELLAKRFEIIPTSASAFTINFIAKDPQLAYQVLQDFVTHLQKVMTIERHTLLLNLHDAIQDQLESISLVKQGETSNAVFSARPDLVQKRIEKIQGEIESLKNAFSEKHPRISALKDQLQRLMQWNKPWVEEPSQLAGQKIDIFADVKVDGPSKELFDDLIRKYRYLEVVIYMDHQNKDHYLSILKEAFVPQSPVWPKLPILLIWGIAFGFLLGSLLAFYKELPHAVKLRVIDERMPHELSR